MARVVAMKWRLRGRWRGMVGPGVVPWCWRWWASWLAWVWSWWWVQLPVGSLAAVWWGGVWAWLVSVWRRVLVGVGVWVWFQRASWAACAGVGGGEGGGGGGGGVGVVGCLLEEVLVAVEQPAEGGRLEEVGVELEA